MVKGSAHWMPKSSFKPKEYFHMDSKEGCASFYHKRKENIWCLATNISHQLILSYKIKDIQQDFGKEETD
jgi:hypothetical protein